MRRVAMVLAVFAGIGLATSPVLAEQGHSKGNLAVQTVSHGHHGHHGHHGYHGYGSYRPGYYDPPAYYGRPAVVYPAPVYPPVYHGHPRYYSYPSSNFHYHGRNFGFSIGF